VLLVEIAHLVRARVRVRVRARARARARARVSPNPEQLLVEGTHLVVSGQR